MTGQHNNLKKLTWPRNPTRRQRRRSHHINGNLIARHYSNCTSTIESRRGSCRTWHVSFHVECNMVGNRSLVPIAAGSTDEPWYNRDNQKKTPPSLFVGSAVPPSSSLLPILGQTLSFPLHAPTAHHTSTCYNLENTNGSLCKRTPPPLQLDVNIISSPSLSILSTRRLFLNVVPRLRSSTVCTTLAFHSWLNSSTILAFAANFPQEPPP